MPRTRPEPEGPARAKTRPIQTDGLGPALAVLAASGLGCIAAAAIFLLRIQAGFELRYIDSGLPMLVEADAYHYLSRSQILLAGAGDWLREPALSVLGALLSLGTRMPLELVAFWLPVGLAAASGLWIWAWGRLLDAPLAHTALAAFACALVPAWFMRASPGWYDTDPGIAFFWHGCLFATACLGLAPARPRPRHALLLAGCALGLCWWWRPGLALLPLCALLWGATFPLCQDRRWRRIRVATCCVVMLFELFLLLTPRGMLPTQLLYARDFSRTHAAMVLGSSSHLVFRSIDELSSVSALDIARELGGNAPAGALALAATLLLCWRRPRTCLFLLPALAGVPLALYSERLLYFAALPVALGVGLLPWLMGETGRRAGRLAWAVSLALVAGMAFHHATRPLAFHFQAPQDRLALALKRVAQPGAKLWNWWDDGYFLAARSGLRPLFDGGSQTPLTAYIAARPLVSDNPLLARRWIRFFALRGTDALPPLLAAWGNIHEVWNRLDTVFSAPDARVALAAQPPLAPGADWLLPEGRVFLYLPQRFLRLSRWWIALGSSPRPELAVLATHIETFERTNFRYIPEKKVVELPEAVLKRGYKDFGGVYLTSREPLAAPFGGGNPGPFVVASDLSPWLYVVDETALASVGFRLLAPGGAPLPGFAPVLANYAHGAVWEVLP